MTTQISAGSPGGRAVPGAIIGGRYQLRAAIGNGGMGTVWQAVDIVLRRDVAVKEVVLPPNMPQAEREAMHERTLREARAAAALSHPSVVQVYDVVTEDARPWIIMELLQARSLSEIIIADGPLSGRAVAKIGVALLSALEVAHAAGVLHRDVKPANVLICADGRCVLTDFGVARMPAESNLTQPGMVLGSPHFISPERAVGAKFGPPSDLFSLGVSLYTAIEGRPPFDRGDPFETMRAIVEDEPLPPVRAGTMAPVLAGLLEKDPDRRWTVNQARTALRELMTVTSRQRSRGARMQVGGRALLPDNEGPRIDPAGLAAAPPASGPPSTAIVPDGALATPGGMPVPAGYEPVPAFLPPPRQRRRERAEPVRPRSASGGRERVGPTQRPYGTDASTGTGSGAPGVAAALRKAYRQVLQTVIAWPRMAQVGAVAGVAVVIVVALIVAFSGGGSPPTGHAAGTPSPSASSFQPPFPTQVFADPRGMSVNVPADWRKKSASTYTNFYSPDDDSQRMRLNVENAGDASARDFLTGAERNLKNKLCDGYTRVGLTDIELDGKPAAQLEYLCGSGDEQRHGIWAAITSGGKAYHFYLTVPDEDYEADLPVYTEMVVSFQLTA